MRIGSGVARQDIIQLISRKKRLSFSHIIAKNSFHKMGFDLLDVVDIILEVERKYKLIIPDEVPLESVDDLVQFLQAKTIS